MLPREISLSGALFSTYLWFPPSLIRPFFVRAFAVLSVLHRSQKGNNFFLSLPEACANFFVIAQYLCHHSVSIDRCKYIPSLIKFFLVQLHYRELKLSHVCFIITYSILVSFPFFLHLVTSDGEDETLWSSVQVQHPRFARGAPRVWPGWGAGLSLDLNRGLSNSPQRSSGWDVALRHRRDAAFTGERPLWTAFSSAESCWSMSWPSRHCLSWPSSTVYRSRSAGDLFAARSHAPRPIASQVDARSMLFPRLVFKIFSRWWLSQGRGLFWSHHLHESSFPFSHWGGWALQPRGRRSVREGSDFGGQLSRAQPTLS